MRKNLCFILLFVYVATLPKAQAQAQQASVASHTEVALLDTQEQPSTNKPSKLGEAILEKELQKEAQHDGLILGFVSALTLLYDAISHTLLYPIFSFLFFAMTAGFILLVTLLVMQIRKDESQAVKILSFALLIYLLIYIDLFLVMYERHKVLLLFVELEKDIVLVLFATSIGFFAGKSLSQSVFEEKTVP